MCSRSYSDEIMIVINIKLTVLFAGIAIKVVQMKNAAFKLNHAKCIAL
jgi:hypothetical protein